MEETKEFWDKRASEITDEIEDTYNDIYKRILETKTLVDLIPSGSSVIDIGCGSGWGTRQFSRKAKLIMGTDFSEEMIAKAISIRDKAETDDERSISYLIEDIRTTKLIEAFDIAISQRCLINVLDVKKQYKAIRNIHKKLASGGVYLMLECGQKGREKLNSARIQAGLEKMPDVPFNLDFEEKPLQHFLSDLFDLEKEIYFGSYDYISRIIYPLSIQPDEPKYISAINKHASEMKVDNKFWKLSRTFLYVLRKK